MKFSDDQLAAMKSTAIGAAHELLHTFEHLEEGNVEKALVTAHLAADDIATLVGDFELREGFWKKGEKP